jgi:hypothetical protein
VCWQGIRGMRWRRLMLLVKGIPSDKDVIVIHLGSNDIYQCPIADNMKKDLTTF